MISRCLSLLVFALVSITVWGCGDDENDFLVSRGSGNSFAATSGTGSLLFSFANAQSAVVPSQSAELKFEFYASPPDSDREQSGEPLLESEQPFAPSVTVSEVPVAARQVRITVYGSTGDPLFILTDEVRVQAGQTTPVDLRDAKTESVTAVGLELFPRQARLTQGETFQFQVLVSYSNGDLVGLTPQQIARRIRFEVEPEGLAEVDSLGRVTPLASGTVTVTALDEALGRSEAELTIEGAPTN